MLYIKRTIRIGNNYLLSLFSIKMQTVLGLMVILFFSAAMALPTTKRGVPMPPGIDGMGRRHQLSGASSVVNYSSNGESINTQSTH